MAAPPAPHQRRWPQPRSVCARRSRPRSAPTPAGGPVPGPTDSMRAVARQQTSYQSRSCPWLAFPFVQVMTRAPAHHLQRSFPPIPWLPRVAPARNPRACGEARDETSAVLGRARSCATRVLVGVRPPTQSGGIGHSTLTSSRRCGPQWSSPLHVALGKCSGFPRLEKLRPVEVAEEFDQLRDDTGPARLVAGAQARAIVTMEIFVEQEVIFPLRIGLKFLRPAVHRPPARPIAQKDPGEPLGDVPGHLEQVHDLARTGRTLDGEGVAVIQIVLK